MSEWWASGTKAENVPIAEVSAEARGMIPVPAPVKDRVAWVVPDLGICSESDEPHTMDSSDIQCYYCNGQTSEYCGEDHDNVGCPDCESCTSCKRCPDCDFDGNCDHRWNCIECGQRFDLIMKGPYAGSMTMRQ